MVSSEERWAQTAEYLTVLLRSLARRLGDPAEVPDDDQDDQADQQGERWQQLPLAGLIEAAEVAEHYALGTVVDLTSELPAADRHELLAHTTELIRRTGLNLVRDAAKAADRQLRQRVDNAVAEQRRQLARDVHDRLGYTLALAFLNLQLYRKAISGKQQDDHHLTAVQEALEQAAGFTRGLVTTLRSDTTTFPRSLTAAINECVAELNIDGLPVNVSVRGDGALVPARHREDLLLVVREFLRNSFSHSAADEIRVGIEIGDGRVTVLAADNGSGFDPEFRSGKQRGFGLSAMRERIELLGGRFTLVTSVGGGTRMEASIPLPQQVLPEMVASA